MANHLVWIVLVYILQITIDRVCTRFLKDSCDLFQNVGVNIKIVRVKNGDDVATCSTNALVHSIVYPMIWLRNEQVNYIGVMGHDFRRSVL